MLNKSTIFRSAWFAAREAAARFGGSARAFFAIALRQAYATARKPVVTERTIEVEAVKNSYGARMQGATYYTFAYLPDGKGGFRRGVRADKLDGALFLSRASYVSGGGYARSSDRHSATVVRVALPVGTILKSTRGTAERIDADGETDLKLVGNMRRDGGWVSVVADETGREIELA